MTLSQWKEVMEELLDGVQQELGSTVPIKTKVALNTFRRRLHSTLVARRRKRFEQELEAFLQSKRALRVAAERYVCKKIPPAIEAAIAVLKRAQRLLAKGKGKRKGPHGFSH
jgi:hypothetical protein